MDVADLREQRHSGQCFYASQTAQCFDLSSIRGALGIPFDITVERITLSLHVLEMFELSDHRRVQRTLEFPALFLEPVDHVAAQRQQVVILDMTEYIQLFRRGY